MMLARRHDEWYLAAFAAHIAGCNLSTTRKPRHDTSEFHLWRDKVWVWSNAPTNGVLFFPRLLWNRRTVTPVYWHQESTEPLLLCRMETHDLGARNEKEYQQMAKEMRTLGWDWDLREGGHKYIHVDDLEKIEGPPTSVRS
jgi:hypothetical protein